MYVNKDYLSQIYFYFIKRQLLVQNTRL